MTRLSSRTCLITSLLFSLFFLSTPFASSAQKPVTVSPSSLYSATEKPYGNQKIGVVSYKGRSIMRLVAIPRTNDSVLIRAQKIAAAFNASVPNREATQKISLKASANIYHVACDNKPLFDFYPEDTVFNGVNNTKLLRSWITNITRIMDLP